MRGPYLLELRDREDLLKAYRSAGCDPAGIKIMLDKAQIYPLLIKDVKSPAANALKQHMLSCGGEAVVPGWAIDNARPLGDVLLLGTPQEYGRLCEKLSYQPWGLRELGRKLTEMIPGLSQRPLVTWQWADGKQLELGRQTRVMGILNVTPDSFSDGGKYLEPDKALQRARAMVKEGADIIDVGGESTRPNARAVTAEEELERVYPILDKLIRELEVPLSLDTYKIEVAREGLKLGVHIINDVGGLREPAMASLLASYDRPVIVMHNPLGDSAKPYPYNDVLADVTDSLAACQQAYLQAGLAKGKIVLDPGIGFSKSQEQNLLLIRHIQNCTILGSPILLGASRKSFVGRVLDTQVGERLEGSLAVAAWGTTHGVDILRVHDVQETVRIVKMLTAIQKAGEQA